MDFRLVSLVIFVTLASTTWASYEESLENDELRQRLEELDRREVSEDKPEPFLDESLEHLRRETSAKVMSKRGWSHAAVGATVAAVALGWRRRRSADGKIIAEKDTFKIDPQRKIVLDEIASADGKELTISDYNLGVMAVLKSEDKICRLHQLPEEAKGVNLKEERRHIYALSKAGKNLNLIQEGVQQFQESSKPVVEKDVGAKIARVCNGNGYKMVWMEPLKGTEKREKTDDQPSDDAADDITDPFLDEDKAETKRSRTKGIWQCGRACNNYTYSKSPYRFCRNRCGWGSKYAITRRGWGWVNPSWPTVYG